MSVVLTVTTSFAPPGVSDAVDGQFIRGVQHQAGHDLGLEIEHSVIVTL